MIISNKLNITYNTVKPNGEIAQEIAESNTVNTEILSYSVSKEIASDKTNIQEGETAHNTVTITNTSQTKLFNNLFKIPELNCANYVEGSVKINGVAQPGLDPISGFALPDLAKGESITVEYDIVATNPTASSSSTHFATLDFTVNDPLRGTVNYSENTDTLLLNVITDKISVIKSVDKAFAVKGENLHYKITITNIGNVTKSNLIFKDPIPVGTSFISNSIKINGTNFTVYNPNIGFALRTLAPGEVTTIEFDVKVN